MKQARFKTVLMLAGLAVLAGGRPSQAQEAFDSDSIAVVGVYSHWGTRYPQNVLTGPGDSITRETMWTTASVNEPGHIVFSLNDRVHLTQLEIWNWNDAPGTYANIGMEDVEILVSTDWGVSYLAITNPANQTTVFTLTKGPNSTAIQPDIIPINHAATHLKLDPQTLYGNRSGLSYVRFYGTRPGEPGTRNRPITEMAVYAFSSNNSTLRNANNTLDGTPYSIDANTMWLANEVAAWIVFDLDGVRRLNHLNFWNYAQSGYTTRGMRTIRLSGSMDGISFWPLAALPDGEVTLRQALVTESSLTGQFVYVDASEGGGSAPMAYLKLECLTNYGNATLSGLSEIQFFERILPPAGTLIQIR